MDNTLFNIHEGFSFSYLDDTLISSDMFYDQLKEEGRNQDEIQLFQRQFHYLGSVISSNAYQIDHTNIKAVTDLLNQKPRTVGKVRNVLCLLAPYRRYIDSLLKIAQLLYMIFKRNPVSISSSQVPTSSKMLVPGLMICSKVAITICMHQS